MTLTAPKNAFVAVPLSEAVIRREMPADVAAREVLLDRCFGTDRHARTCQRLRDGNAPAPGLAFTAIRDGRLIGTLRLWPIDAGGVAALLLGPLAVDEACRGEGLGARLIATAIAEARARGHRAILLLGDAAYYERFGFRADRAMALALPGPFERSRLQALELTPDALTNARGIIRPMATRSTEKHRRRAA